MTALLAGDRVQLSIIGREKLPNLDYRMTGVIVEMNDRRTTVKLLLDGQRAPVWFPKHWWQREEARPQASAPPVVERVRQEERPATVDVAGTPEAQPRASVSASPPPAGRAPLIVTCLICGHQERLPEGQVRPPGPFVYPRHCDQWMVAPPIRAYQPVPLMAWRPRVSLFRRDG